MPSSTFSSDRARGAVLVLLASVATILLSAEILTRLVVARHSKVEVMMASEHREALALRPGSANRPRQLLVVGSSFVGMDLDLPGLQRELAPGWEAHRYWLYNTYYNDWYFGLKRLLAEGSRPDVVAVTFPATSWYVSSIRGDYSSWYLFEPRDLARIERQAGLDNTETSNLFFARYSRFFALRSEIRKVLLEKMLPDLSNMYNLFHPTAGKPLTGPEVSAVIGPRIADTERLLARYGVALILIVPPLPRPGQEFHRELLDITRPLGIPVVMPYSCLDLPKKDYLDDVHLTPQGAHIFTSTIAPLLAPALDRAIVTSGHLTGQRKTAILHSNQTQTPVVGEPLSIAAQRVR